MSLTKQTQQNTLNTTTGDNMKVGDLVKLPHENSVGIVIEIKPHPYLDQRGNFCTVQWPNHVNKVMCSWLEVISESR